MKCIFVQMSYSSAFKWNRFNCDVIASVIGYIVTMAIVHRFVPIQFFGWQAPTKMTKSLDDSDRISMRRPKISRQLDMGELRWKIKSFVYFKNAPQNEAQNKHRFHDRCQYLFWFGLVSAFYFVDAEFSINYAIKVVEAC